MWYYLFLTFMDLICSICFGIATINTATGFQIFTGIFCTISWAFCAGINLCIFIDEFMDKRD
jgi:hypothetical protein